MGRPTTINESEYYRLLTLYPEKQVIAIELNLYPVNNTELRHLKKHRSFVYNVVTTRS